MYGRPFQNECQSTAGLLAPSQYYCKIPAGFKCAYILADSFCPLRGLLITEASATRKRMPRNVRFYPPTAPLDPVVHWALLRAFGPIGATGPAIQNHSEVGQVTRRLGLMSRVFGRCPRDFLRAELGAFYDDQAREMHVTAARGLALERCLRVVDSAAEALNVPYALIKGAALMRTGVTPVGLRGSCDVDILLSNRDASLLQSRLKSSGFRERTPTHPRYHYPMLIDDAGGAVEIHTSLPLMRISPRQRQVSFQHLREGQRLGPAPELSRFAHVPSPEILLAHAISHAIAQHGYLPQSYPLLRLVADAVDLDLVNNSDRMKQALSFVQPDVSEQEVYALRDLAEALLAGNVASAWSDNGTVGRLLRHMVCGSLDSAYCSGLKVYQAAYLLRSAPGEFVREYGRATFALPHADLSRIYGTASHGHESRYLRLRPLDVVARVLRMIPNAASIMKRQLATLTRR